MIRNGPSSPLSRPKLIRDNRVVLDRTTQKNLELCRTLKGERKHTLLWVLDRTSTAMGSRELTRWITAPYRDTAIPNQRLTHIRELIDSGLITSITDHLKRIGDLERIVARIGLRSARPRDLTRLRDSLKELPELKHDRSIKLSISEPVWRLGITARDDSSIARSSS